MKKKKIIILIIQIALIIIATFGFFIASKSAQSPTHVFVYNKTIDNLNNPLTEDDVAKIEIPKSAVTQDMASNIEDIIGLYVDTKVHEGQYVYKNQLIKLEDVDKFKTLDLSGLRKISLPISFTDGFAGNIKRGDKVDLVFTGEGTYKDEEKGREEKFKYSKVFMQDILVYSVNTGDGYKFVDYSQYSPNENFNNDIEIDTDVSKQDFEIITLAVTLEQAEEIEARANSGKVRFLGRFDDSKSYNTLGYIVGDYQKVYSGQGYAETGNVLVEEDDFDIID